MYIKQIENQFKIDDDQTLRLLTYKSVNKQIRDRRRCRSCFLTIIPSLHHLNRFTEMQILFGRINTS